MPKGIGSGTDFLDSNFLRTDLKDCDFTNAFNYHIDPTTNYIKNIKLSLPEALSVLRIIGIDLQQ